MSEKPRERSGLGPPGRLWRLPAALTAVALTALGAVPFHGRFDSGTFARDTVAFVLALGTCSMLLGLGLGLWIAARVRSTPAVATAAAAALVAAAWWWLVYGPLLRPSLGG